MDRPEYEADVRHILSGTCLTSTTFVKHSDVYKPTMFQRKIHQSTNGQWRSTIPPQIIRDLGIEHGEELQIRPVKRGVDKNQVRIWKQI